MHNKKKAGISLIIVLLSLFSVALYILLNNLFLHIDNKSKSPSQQTLEICVLDVDDANATIVTFGNLTMLVDTGREQHAAYIKEKLSEYNVKKLDILVITHAHSDHYGGFKSFGALKIDKTYISPYVSESAGYTYALDYIAERCDDITKLKYQDTFMFGEVLVEIMGPVKESYNDINDTSLVLKLTYQKVSILITADAEGIEINDILDLNADLSADVLFIAHHGSNADNTNSYRMLNAVMPKYAVIQCAGEYSDYGYPHENVLSRLSDLGCEVYRTDLNGEITIITDGKNIEITTQK